MYIVAAIAGAAIVWALRFKGRRIAQRPWQIEDEVPPAYLSDTHDTK